MDTKTFTVADIYTHEKISDRLFVVRESYSRDHRFPIGVVIGNNQAAVIDSGLGVTEGLRRYVETLTDKPLVCYLTHGHSDHASGSVLFDTAYLNERDYPILNLDKGYRLSTLKSYCQHNEAIMAYAAEHCLDCSGAKFQNIEDGDVVDLGGERLEVIKVPGHSPGSVAYYNRVEGYAFGGDAILKRTHLTGMGKQSLLEYARTIERFLSKVEDGITLFIGHQQDYVFPGNPTLQLARDLKTACEEVAAGKVENDIVRAPFYEHQIGGKQREMIHVTGQAMLMYDANNLS